MMRRGLGIAGGLGLWVTVVIVASGARPNRQTWIGTTDVDVLIVGAMTLIAALVLGFLLWVGPGEAPIEPERRGPWGSVASLLLLALVLLVWNAVGPEIDLGFSEGTTVEEGGPTSAAGLTAEDVDAPTPVAELRDLLLLGAGAGALALVAVGVRLRQRHTDSQLSAATEVTHYADALETARARLTIGEDPRAAVLMAYADLEAALEDIGSARTASDTVAEHHQRVLAEHQLDAQPFNTLAALYRTARFSTSALSEEDRDRAVKALDQAIAGLRVPA